MSQTADIFRAGISRALAGDHLGFLDTFADDIEFEFPFAPEGRPARLSGKEEVAAYMAPMVGRYQGASLAALTVYETDVPDTIVAEMSINFVTPDGASAPRPFIAVVRSAGGKVVSYRDYWKPAAA